MVSRRGGGRKVSPVIVADDDMNAEDDENTEGDDASGAVVADGISGRRREKSAESSTVMWTRLYVTDFVGRWLQCQGRDVGGDVMSAMTAWRR